MKKLVLVVLLLGVTFFVGCGGGSNTGGGGGGGNTPTLVSISITPAAPTIALKATQQFTATGSFSDGSTKNLTSVSNWLSSSGAVATINSAGLATAVAPGTTTITASSGGVTGSTTLTVANALVSIAVTPPIASIAPSATQQFTAIGTFADGSTQDLTSSSTTTWASSGSPIATVSGTGLATGVAPGTVTISATSAGITGSAALTVTNPLVSIAVTPANSSVHQGTKPQFTAIGTYFDHSSVDITAAVTWTSSNTTAATISNSPGLWGLATALAAGQTTITATCTPPSPACPTGNPVSGNTLLTVSSATIVSIAVTPANAPIGLGLQQQYTALATYNDGTTQDVTNIVQWTSSDTTTITITTSGLATGVHVTTNPVTITAKDPSSSVSGSTTATVNAGNLVSIALKPTNITTLAQGTSQQFSAIGTFSNGSTLDITNQVNWQSSDVTLATVKQKTGVVKAAQSVASPGPVTITATLSGISASVTLNITNATPTGVTVTPITATIQPGATQSFRATAQFNDGTFQDVTLDSTWTSSNTSVAVVNFPGRVLGVAPGTVTVTATFITVPGTASLTVNSAVLTSITLTPNSANLKPGATVSFQATGHYNDGSTTNLTGLAVWASSDQAVVTVNNGVALGQGVGPANVTAAYQGQTGTAAVVVTSQLLTTIVITPANPTTYVGVGLQLTATGDPNTQNIGLTASATWASSAPTVATVSNASTRQGLVTGIGPGTSTITAVFAGITGTTTLTVSNATLTSIAVTPASATITAGSTQQYKAVGTFSDGKTLDLTSQVNWSSSAPNVAPIGTSGLASGATTGTTTITATFLQPGQQLVTSNPATLNVQ
jgi:uncharacterized protein YjdB